MEAPTLVLLRSKSTVVPTIPTPAGTTYQLTNLDLQMELHYVRAVYFFCKGSFREAEKPVIRFLKRSLTGLLSRYPMASGRLSVREDRRSMVILNDAGVRILEAVSAEVSMQRELDNHEMHSHLSPAADMSMGPDKSTSPLVTIQFTEFPCGGLSIGICWAHILGDSLTLALFMKSWGEIHRGAQISRAPFLGHRFVPRPDLTTRTRSTKYYASMLCNSGGKDQYEVENEALILHFTSEMVQECISTAQKGLWQYDIEPTPFECISALVWQAITRSWETMSSSSEETAITLCLDFRSRVNPCISPLYYFGNALHFAGVCCKAGNVRERDLSFATSLIHKSIREQVNLEEIQSVVDFMEERENLAGHWPEPKLLYGSNLTFVDWEELPSYEAIFNEELERPVEVGYWVDPIEGEGTVVVLPSFVKGMSRDVIIRVPRDRAQKLRNEPTISKYSK